MKKFDSFKLISILGIAFWVGVPILIGIYKSWELFQGNIIVFLHTILAIPFMILAAITFVRGVVHILFEKDGEKFEHYWKFCFYLIANIVGFLAIVLAIIQIY